MTHQEVAEPPGGAEQAREAFGRGILFEHDGHLVRSALLQACHCDERFVGITGMGERGEQPLLVDARRDREGLEAGRRRVEVVEARPRESTEGRGLT